MTTECAVLAGGCYWGMQDFFADTTAFCQRASATQVRKRVPRCSDDSAAASVKAVLNETGGIDIPVNNASYEWCERSEERQPVKRIRSSDGAKTTR